MTIKSIFERLQHCVLRSHLSPAEAGSSKIGCLCSSEEAQTVDSNCCDIRQGNHPAPKVPMFIDGALLQWDRRLETQGLAHESGEATVCTQGKAVCMGDMKKPLLPPRCTVGSSTLRQGALCSPLNFFTKSQTCLCLPGFSQFTSLKPSLLLNPY